ncbi:hypothetical protein [Vibrio sp. J383]|uniref:hypothetical protein n=1 Tax=Vibrio sp. J383 TaxID=2942997 RepID=UPI0020C077A3|nr:hypothetical protein [Vibrio sp. J383]UQV23190.1 hypothetical protein M4S28_21850 [Vibrio sp. J383]
MSGTIVFIDDSAAVRRTYQRRLSRVFGSEYSIECPELSPDLESMLHTLSLIEDKVTYFIDEDLVHEGIAEFMGSELIERIRVNDPSIPIYILTSDLTRVEEPLGNIEFAIDKNSWDESKDQYAKRFFRHIKTLKTIKTEQAKRFDELFGKSLVEPLTEEEKVEYDELNVVRSKTLVDEAVISDESLAKLDRQSRDLQALYEEIQAFKGGNSSE